MGDYNPDAGLIVGQEWAPIVNQPYTLNREEEIGWTFNLATPEVVSSGKIYISQAVLDPFPGGSFQIDNTYVMGNLYPAGTEGNTGPMKQAILEISGGAIAGAETFTFPFGNSVRDALYYQGDNKTVNFVAASADPTVKPITMQFNATGHPELAGKRIVKVELIYVISANGLFHANSKAGINQNYGVTPATITATVAHVETNEFLSHEGGNFDDYPAVKLADFNVMSDNVASLNAALVANTTFGTPVPAYPWTYETLKLLDIGAGANEQSISVNIISPLTEGIGSNFIISYAALRVTYCEEQRVAFGGHCRTMPSNSSQFSMRSPNLVPNSAVVPAGAYTLTVDGGRLDTDIYAAKELYQLPGQKGVVIDKTDHVGESFVDRPTDQLVMLSIHKVNGDIIIGPHGYGPQDEADSNIYPSTTQTSQGIINNSADGALPYPTARFYARRFGETTGALSLTSSTNAAITASITVAEFDALPEIADGWKQVDLRFTGAPPVFDNSQTVQEFYWSSTTPIGANWQIMLASSVARTGVIPSTLIVGADAPLQNNYGNDDAYARQEDLPQVAMDATLLFAQDMPAVSGLTLIPATLPVTGIGLDCGIPPDCVPTGISYHQLTWDALAATSVPASGFGYYEIQRSDEIDPVWRTILQATSPLVTGFSDFEARTDKESSYRIRFQHRLLFPSAWSNTVTGTIPAPGVTGSTANNGNGVLIFTTNERQTGNSSLAYAMVWSSKVEEGFTFIEAGDVVLQKMYDRDYQVAFRPLERGGERFTRTMLVQAAAVPDGLIQHGFTTLRDLAWEDVSYVCVRDELGDRWLATVIVPEGTVERNRRLYLAQVDIVEVTATPSVVMLPSATMGAGGASSGCVEATWNGLPGWDYGCWGA